MHWEGEKKNTAVLQAVFKKEEKHEKDIKILNRGACNRLSGPCPDILSRSKTGENDLMYLRWL